MARLPGDEVEELLAAALAALDDGGDAALERFLEQHPHHQPALRRGIEQCRAMGLLGTESTAREFPERLGEFALVRRVGGGGMGVVYEAEQTSLGRRVALKVIRPELLFFEGARERFRREIEAIARLSHPAVVPVLASGEQDGVPFFAMELVAGKTVQEICTELAGRPPADLEGRHLAEILGATAAVGGVFEREWWRTCTQLARTVALGLRHVHLRGIVHRDVKPSNVMVTPLGQAVILDFGVALIADGRDFTRTGSAPGSPAFMSPEQLRGEPTDERTDVYSLAATLWQMLALEPPFHSGHDVHVRILRGDVPDVRDRNGAVPRDLGLVIRTAMDRDRGRRYSDMEAFAADLQAVLMRRPIRARRLGMGLRAVRWCQRHRTATTLIATISAAAAVMPAVIAWRERGKNVELAAARQLAEDSLSSSVGALHRVVERIANDKLRHVPQADALTLAALEDAVGVYRDLLLHYPDHAELRQRAGMGLSSLAAALERAGRQSEAVPTARDAVAVLGGDSMDEPPGILDGRAYANLNLAGLLAGMGRWGEAGRAVAAAERDWIAVSDRPGYRRSVLRGRSELTNVRAACLSAEGRDDAAEQAMREGLRLSRERYALDPDDIEITAQEIGFLDNLATRLADQKRPDEVEPLLDEALLKVRAMPADAATWPSQPMLLSTVLQTRGIHFLHQQDGRCLADLRECLSLRERIASDFPTNVELRSHLGAACHNLGNAYFQQARDNDALPLLLRARDLQRSCVQDSPEFQMPREYLATTLRLLGSCLRHLGRREELTANAEELVALSPDRSTFRTAAVHFLRAIELLAAEPPTDHSADLRERYRRRALDLLLDAERLGWGPGSRLHEPLYAPLRDVPEFAALAERVAERNTRAAGTADIGSDAEPGQGADPAPPSTSSTSRDKPR